MKRLPGILVMGFQDMSWNRGEQNPAPWIYGNRQPNEQGFEPRCNGMHVQLQGGIYQFIAQGPSQGIMWQIFLQMWTS